MWLSMFRVSTRPSSGAYNCNRSLWFYLWKEKVGALLVVVWPYYGPGVDSSSNRKEYQEYFLWVKAAGA
jgi:hypothetical protein